MSDILDQLAAQPPPQPPPPSAALEAELARLAPVGSRRPARQLAIVVGASLVYATGLLAILTVRRDAGELPVAWIACAGLAWLGGFTSAGFLALVPRAGSMTPRWQLAAASAVVTSIAFVSLGLAIHPDGPSSKHLYWAQVERGHWCLWLGLATSLVPIALGAIFLRGALAIRSRWIAAGLGAAGGCLGGLLLHLHCPIADGAHIGVVHGGVVVVAALLAAAVVPRATDQPLR